MPRNKFYMVERDGSATDSKDWNNGWWVVERATFQKVAFSSDLHGAISICDFMEKTRNMKEQEK